MKLIERYILRRLTLALFVSAAGIVAVIWIAQAIQRVDVIASQGQGIGLYIFMTSLGVPSLLSAVLPIALMLAYAHTVRTLNSDSELVVINASGASRWVVAKPFLAVAFIASLIIYWLALSLGPASMAKLRGFVTEVRSDLVSVVIQEGQFRRLAGGLTFHVGERATGGLLREILIRDEREETETFTYMAREGAVEKVGDDAFLVLRDGQLQRSVPGSQNLSTVAFTSYAYNLSSLAGGVNGGYSGSREIPTADLFSPPTDHPYYKRSPGTYRSEFHNRLSAGLYPFAFALVVLLAAGNARSNRGNMLGSLIWAGLICVVVRGSGIAAVSAARGSAAAVPLVWLVPLGTIALCLAALPFGRRLSAPAWFVNAIAKAAGPLVRLRPRAGASA